jgi:thiol-disulfide isomerase/thioredoxin
LISIPRSSALSITITVVLLASALAAGCQNKNGSTVSRGSALPGISLPSTEGRVISIPGATKGDLTVILFWSQGCHYCKREMPLIEPLYRKYSDKGFSFVAIHMGPGMEAVRSMKEDMGLSFPIVIDENSSLGKLYGIVSVPTMFVLDRNGIVMEKVLGGLGAGDIEKLIKDNI